MAVNCHWKKKPIFREKWSNNRLYAIWLATYAVWHMAIYNADSSWEVINHTKSFPASLLEPDSNSEYIL